MAAAVNCCVSTCVCQGVHARLRLLFATHEPPFEKLPRSLQRRAEPLKLCGHTFMPCSESEALLQL
jgi:hypothetical protein